LVRAINSSQNRSTPRQVLAEPWRRADVQHLTGVGAAGHQRVIAAAAGVAEPGARLWRPKISPTMLSMSMTRRSSPGPAPAIHARCRARSSWRTWPNVKARTKVPSVEGRHAVAEHGGRLPREQQVTVIDAVRPERHRADQGHHLAARIGNAVPVAEIDGRVDQLLDSEALRQQRRQHHTRIHGPPAHRQRRPPPTRSPSG
jgi:hypothetical protein